MKTYTNGYPFEWLKRTDGKRMFKTFKTVSNTVRTAEENFRMDAVNVQTAKEKFQTDAVNVQTAQQKFRTDDAAV